MKNRIKKLNLISSVKAGIAVVFLIVISFFF